MARNLIYNKIISLMLKGQEWIRWKGKRWLLILKLPPKLQRAGISTLNKQKIIFTLFTGTFLELWKKSAVDLVEKIKAWSVEIDFKIQWEGSTSYMTI